MSRAGWTSTRAFSSWRRTSECPCSSACGSSRSSRATWTSSSWSAWLPCTGGWRPASQRRTRRERLPRNAWTASRSEPTSSSTSMRRPSAMSSFPPSPPRGSRSCGGATSPPTRSRGSERSSTNGSIRFSPRWPSTLLTHFRTSRGCHSTSLSCSATPTPGRSTSPGSRCRPCCPGSSPPTRPTPGSCRWRTSSRRICRSCSPVWRWSRPRPSGSRATRISRSTMTSRTSSMPSSASSPAGVSGPRCAWRSTARPVIGSWSCWCANWGSRRSRCTGYRPRSIWPGCGPSPTSTRTGCAIRGSFRALTRRCGPQTARPPTCSQRCGQATSSCITPTTPSRRASSGSSSRRQATPGSRPSS